MNVTITAKGYAGIKGEVTEVCETGAYIAIERAGIDLAPRNIFFVFEALKGIDASAYTPGEKPLHEYPHFIMWSKRQEVGSIAGKKAHHLTVSVMQEKRDGQPFGERYESARAACGTERHARQGGHYQLHIRKADEVTCVKCAKR